MRLIVAVTLLIGTTAPRLAEGQGSFPPESLVNVKFFKKNTPVRDVIGFMRNISGTQGALGVRCTYCHVGEEGKPLTTYDFASDEKRPKLVARAMMEMVRAINVDLLSAVPNRPQPLLNVACETCHRGVARPVPIEVLIENALTSGGADSASRTYRALRDTYAQRGSYNFTAFPLTNLAMALGARGQQDNGIAIARMATEFHPQAGIVPFTLGELLLAKRDTAAAVAAYRAAVALEPGLVQAQQRLRQLVRP